MISNNRACGRETIIGMAEKSETWVSKLVCDYYCGGGMVERLGLGNVRDYTGRNGCEIYSPGIGKACEVMRFRKLNVCNPQQRIPLTEPACYS